MKKIIVIFHSQQYGNTRILAEAVAEEVQEAGGKVNLINTNERRVLLEKLFQGEIKKFRCKNCGEQSLNILSKR